MRRITVKYAKPGMILGAPVYDNYGNMLLDSQMRLDESLLDLLRRNGVVEIFLDDWRLVDVVVEPLISPELEGKAAKTLYMLITSNQGKDSIASQNIDLVVRAINAIVNEMVLETLGEPAVVGILVQEDYLYVQPVKTALLALVLGKRLGFTSEQLVKLGTAVMLKDVGYIYVPLELLNKPDKLTAKEKQAIQNHPVSGHNLLAQHKFCQGPVAEAILQHHERWNGGGYPRKLKGEDISQFAQIIAITDTYVSLLSKRPGRQMFMPHQAIEYIMAQSNDQFNPDLVELFVREIPCYPTGITVKLNTKELAVVSDAKLGYIARPKVRVVYDEEQGPIKKPYEMDLSKMEYQSKLIVEVKDYF